jgi:hypothetical protein
MSYPSGPYTPPSYVGGDGGDKFGVCAALNAAVKTLIVYKASGDHSLTGIKVTYTDGKTDTVGPCTGDNTSFTFQLGEKITQYTQWGNGYGSAFGRIEFTTDKNNT